MADELEAVQALRARGVDGAEKFLQAASPDQILAVCRRFDKRDNVGPGLLVRWIRDQDFAEPPVPKPSSGERMRVRFGLAVERYPVGSTVESHLALQRRRYEWEAEHMPCAGRLVVRAHAFPLLEGECSDCDYQGWWLAGDLVDGDGRAPEDVGARA